MSIVQQFNGLNGCTVSRKQVRAMIAEANRQEQYQVSDRLTKLLDSHKDKSLTLKVTQPAIEVVPESFLHCLDCEHDKDDKIAGLGKAVSSNEIYQMIADRMIQQIKAAKGGYVQEWKGSVYGKGYLIPFNFITKKAYRGVNRYLLTGLKPLENPFFMTFKQVGELGGKVKKGAKGHEVVYFTRLYRYADTAQKINVASYDIKKFISMIERLRHKITRLSGGMSLEAFARLNALPILKYYNVYNGKDIEGIDFKLADFKHGYIENEMPATEENRLQMAEAIIKRYPAPQPKLKHGGNRAYYSPGGDNIQLPHFADFKTVQGYYTTAFHEFAHSTGHGSRLARDFSGSFGSKKYAFEELIAEFGATFLSAEAGLLWHTNDNHAKYLKNWNSVLTHLQEDNRFLMRAATQAQALCDFVLDNDEAGNPAYFQDIKPVETKVKAPKADKKTDTPAKPVATRKKRKTIDPAQTTMALNGRKKAAPKGLAMPVAMPCETPQVAETINPEIVNTFPVAAIENITATKFRPGSIADRRQKRLNQVREYYKVNSPELKKFLGNVEIKQKESVVITIAAPQGSGKTRFLFQIMGDLGENYKCGHASMEEHPDSSLYETKANDYLSDYVQNTLEAPEINKYADFEKLVRENDIIFIDSWAKLLEMNNRLTLDQDLRKKYDGKLFVIIYQLTTDGKMRGGSASQFDGDIILMGEKSEDYKEHKIITDKNRYNDIPACDLKFNIFSKKMVEIAKPVQANTEPIATHTDIPGAGLKFKTI